jgi:hypothetical protein
MVRTASDASNDSFRKGKALANPRTTAAAPLRRWRIIVIEGSTAITLRSTGS